MAEVLRGPKNAGQCIQSHGILMTTDKSFSQHRCYCRACKCEAGQAFCSSVQLERLGGKAEAEGDSSGSDEAGGHLRAAALHTHPCALHRLKAGLANGGVHDS